MAHWILFLIYGYYCMKLYSAMMILLIKGSAERSFTHLPQRFSHCFVCGLYLERRPTSQHEGIITGGIKGKQKIIANLHSACCIHLDNQVWFFQPTHRPKFTLSCEAQSNRAISLHFRVLEWSSEIHAAMRWSRKSWSSFDVLYKGKLELDPLQFFWCKYNLHIKPPEIVSTLLPKQLVLRMLTMAQSWFSEIFAPVLACQMPPVLLPPLRLCGKQLEGLDVFDRGAVLAKKPSNPLLVYLGRSLGWCVCIHREREREGGGRKKRERRGRERERERERREERGERRERREREILSKKSLGAKFPTYAQMQQQWREESLEEKESEEKVSRKKIKVCEKVEKSQLFWSSGGSTSGVKAAGVEPSGRMIDPKLPTAVARSIFGTKHPRFGTLLHIQLLQKCMQLWREAHFEVKKSKAHHSRSTFGSWAVQKVRPAAARVRPLLDVQAPFYAAGAMDSAPCQKWSKRAGFAAVLKTMAGVGRLKRICKKDKKCRSCDRRSTRDIFVRHVRRSGRWFPETGCSLEHHMSSFLRWFWVTNAALCMAWPHFFVAGAILQCTSIKWGGKIANTLVRGCQLCTPLSIFEGSLADLFVLELSTSISWGSFAELLPLRQTDR